MDNNKVYIYAGNRRQAMQYCFKNNIPIDDMVYLSSTCSDQLFRLYGDTIHLVGTFSDRSDLVTTIAALESRNCDFIVEKEIK